MTETEPDVGHYLLFIRAVLLDPVPDQAPAGRIDDLTAAVDHAEELVTAFPDLDELVAGARFHAAWARDELYDLTGDPAHLDREIEHLRALPDSHTLLGLVLAQRFRAAAPDDPDRLAHLTEAMGLLSEAEHTTAPDDPDRPEIVASLGHLYVMSHLIPPAGAGDTRSGDLDHGIELLRSVAEYYADAAERLATALGIRHSEQNRPADRDEAIELLERLCVAVPEYLDDCAADLGGLYLARLDEQPTKETFERTVECLEHALRQRLPDTEFLQMFLLEAYLIRWGRVPPRELARLHAVCVEMAGDDPFWSDLRLLIDVENALSGGERLRDRATTVAGALFGPYREDKDTGVLAGLLAALLARLHGAEWPDWSPVAMGAKGSVEAATELLGWLRCHPVPEDSPDHALYVAGTALLTAHLPVPHEDAVAVLDNALDTLPADHPAVAMLAYERGRRFSPPGTADPRAHVERSLALLSDAATRFPADDPARARCLGALGTGLFSAYSQGFVRQSVIERADELISGTLGEAQEPEFEATQLMALGMVRGMRWLVDPAGGDMRNGLALLEQARSRVPDDHPLRLDIRYCVALLLVSRSQLTRNLDDATTAETHLLAIQPLLEEHDGFATAPEVASMLCLARLARLTYGDTVTDEGAAELDDVIDELAAKPDPDAADNSVLAYAQLVRANRRGETHEAVRLMSLLEDSATAYPEHMPFMATIRSIGTMATANKAVMADDRQGFEDCAASLTDRAHAPDTSAEERARFLYMAGGMWVVAHTRWQEPHLLDRAITTLEECREQEIATAEPFGLLAREQLSTLYWKRGDAERALECGFAALRDHARQVLLHEEVAHGASKASTMADTAHALALRCVAAGQPERAVAAVEGGRGLAMHAATSDVGAVLRALGHESVALEWEHRADRVEIPTDLRYRVMALLAGTDEERALLSTPSPEDIAGALREIGADALVYLVPAAGDERGLALYVTPDGKIGTVPLPMLTAAKGAEVDRYLAAYRTAHQGHAIDRWRAELGELVRWAWPAVVGPVLAALDTETPHVVLVPCGPLGVVPWHAACDDNTYAITRATFSYVASARQLCDVATRPRRAPAEDAVVVADPLGDLYGSKQEARYLYEHCYPDGLFYGVVPDDIPQDGEGSPDEVLAMLDASVLHLACHAVTGTTPAGSYVELTEHLTVTRVLRHHATGGGLVVLAACVSDVTDREHDEALTLATAFLAAGAASVVGTRWAVDDRRSAVLMCLFHHYLTVHELSPARALRAAQLWALDPDRELPAEIAAVLGTTRPAIPLTTWAAFSHQGR